jgi:hypothetical protein
MQQASHTKWDDLKSSEKFNVVINGIGLAGALGMVLFAIVCYLWP